MRIFDNLRSSPTPAKPPLGMRKIDLGKKAVPSKKGGPVTDSDRTFRIIFPRGDIRNHIITCWLALNEMRKVI